MDSFWFMLICIALAWSWLWLPLLCQPAGSGTDAVGTYTVQVEGQPDYHTASWNDAWQHATAGKGGGKILVGR